MNFDALLEVARTFRGPQLAAVARAQGENLELAGVALRSVSRQQDPDYALLVFDCLVKVDMQHRPGVIMLAVSPKGYALL